MNPRRSITAFVALALGLTVAPACGGRYTDTQRLAADGALAPTGAIPAADGPAPASTAPATDLAATGASAAPASGADQVSPAGTSPTAGGPTAARGAAVPSAQAGSSAAAASAGGAPQAGPAGGAAPAAGSGASAGPAGGGAVPGSPGPAASGPKAPVKLASIGTRSGVIGAIFDPYHEGAVAWVTDVNRRGGLAGHPVQLISVDDGDDPRRAVAAAKRLVEEEKVTAFYAEHAVTSFDAIIPYLEEKGMPVIGSAVPNVSHENTPIFFNLGVSSREGLLWMHLLPVYLFHPEVKDIGVLHCGEAEVCKTVNADLQAAAPKYGYRVRYTAQVSVAQPDYTAEVLAARNAGAKALVLVMDNHSAVRIATSAHRQGYTPFFSIQGSGHSEKLVRDGGKEVEGFLMGGQGLHWETPLLDDFRAAYRAAVPNGAGLSSFAIASWNSGKLLEKVAPAWPDNPGPADVIASLRALRGETLGGLVPPATFRPGERAGNTCSVMLRVENGKFVPYQGRNEYSCAPAVPAGGGGQ